MQDTVEPNVQVAVSQVFLSFHPALLQLHQDSLKDLMALIHESVILIPLYHSYPQAFSLHRHHLTKTSSSTS
jgi:hypothetical protein